MPSKPTLATSAPLTLMQPLALERLDNISLPVMLQTKFDGIRMTILNGVAYSKTKKVLPNRTVQEFASSGNWDGFDGELLGPLGAGNAVDSKGPFGYNVFDVCEMSKLWLPNPEERCKKLAMWWSTDRPAVTHKGISVGLVDTTYILTRQQLYSEVDIRLVVQDHEGIILRNVFQNMCWKYKIPRRMICRVVATMPSVKDRRMIGAIVVTFGELTFTVGVGKHERRDPAWWHDVGTTNRRFVEVEYSDTYAGGTPKFPRLLREVPATDSNNS